MAHLLVLRRGRVIVLAIAAAACGDARVGSVEQTMTSRSAIYGGVEDAETAETNTVVNFGDGCTGTLITPRIVLTAAHCLDGVQNPTSNQSRCAPVSRWIRLGPSGKNAEFKVSSTATKVAGCYDGTHPGEDIALLYLATSVAPSSIPDSSPATTPAITRPTFDASGTDLAGSAGYSAYDAFNQPLPGGLYRRAVAFPAILPSRTASCFPSLSCAFWQITSSPFELSPFGWRPGDSGGPLFVLRGNIRDPIGVTTESGGTAFGDEAKFSDITWPNNRDWIIRNVEEGSVSFGHSAAWLVSHGKTTKDWWGEADYSGPCQKTRDRDCDGWDDVPKKVGGPVHDNCPYVPNPDQTDADDNGIGDDCRWCPFDPDNDQTDQDHVCVYGDASQTPLPLYKRDNCPTAFNPKQENCNVLAEGVRQQADPSFPFLGDACDPVPCPQSGLAPGETVTTCTPQPGGWEDCSARVIRSRLTSNPLGAYDPNFVPIRSVPTAPRFCQQQLPDFDCTIGPVMRDEQLLSDEPLNPARPWHQISFGQLSALGLPPPRGELHLWDYINANAGDFSFSQTNTWFFRTDYAQWVATRWVPLPTSDPSCNSSGTLAGTCLRGRFWLNAGNGTTPHGADVRGPNLANFHLDVAPDPLKVYCREPQHFVLQAASAASTNAMIGATTTSSAYGEFLWASSTTAEAGFELNPVGETQLITPAPFGLLGALQHDGHLIALSDDGTEPCRGTHLSPFVARAILLRIWASAVDPTLGLGTLSERVRAVALTPDGTAVADALISEGTTLRLAERVEDPFASVFAARDGLQPPSRTDPITVFSRAAGGVFVIGGRDMDGARLTDAWFLTLGKAWGRIPLGSFAVGEPLSATYSYSDARLWLADEVSDGSVASLHRFRLSRVDPTDGDAEPVFFVPRRKPRVVPYLSVDRDGSVLLAVADTNRFALLRMQRNAGRVTLTRVRNERGHLVRTPIVDDHGYSFVIKGSDGTLQVKRRSELRNVNCSDERLDEAQALPAVPLNSAACDESLVQSLF